MTDPQPRVAVVILNWNGRKFLEQFLPGVIAHSRPLGRVVVADNASTDDSPDWVRQHCPEAEVLALPTNTGYTGGYNASLKQIQAEYYVLLNSDVEVTAGWLEPLVALADREPSLGAAQPRIRAFHQPDRFEYAGAAGGFIDHLGYPFCRGRIFQELEQDTDQYTDERRVFWATGACMFVRAAVYHQLGGLDDRFFAHMEEIDFCWRLQRAGHEVWVSPKSIVYHVGGGTLPKYNPRKTFLNFRNNLLMLYKNLDFNEFKKVYRIRWWLDRLAALQFLLTSGKADAQAVLLAHRDFNKLRASYPRNEQKPHWKGFPGVYPRSILLDHYLRGIKRFSELERHFHKTQPTSRNL